MTSALAARPSATVSFTPDLPDMPFSVAVDAPVCLRVLIAEDQPLLRRLMMRMIEKLGHQAVAAEDGAQAWKLFVQQPADVVITDWLMPEMDGLALCRRLKADLVESVPYVILASVLDDPRDVRNGLRAGADEYLIKPVAPADLEARLIAVERMIRDHAKPRAHPQPVSDTVAEVIRRLELSEVLTEALGRLSFDAQPTLLPGD
jgi:DNA-binding response OmpR family regulator